MKKASLAIVLGAVLMLSAAVGVAGTSDARAASPPNVQTIWIYRSSFTPSMMWDASGVMVTLVNEDTIAHRIVLYRGSTPTSFNVTLAPGQWYSVSEPLSCLAGCYNATYTFRDANLSYVYAGSCYSFCARLYVRYNGGM
jgi:hypothetical protein